MASAQILYASQDASIKENSSTNGDWSKNEVYGGSTPVIALVEFDLSSFSKGDSIQSATFRPYVRTLKNNQSSSFSIYSTTAKDWSQSSVKWSTRPPKDQLLDTITITKSGSYVNFVVTSAIQDAINNGQSKVTLWIEDSEEEYEGFEFDSVNKNASYPNEPELVIVSGVAEADTTAPTFSSAATSTDGTKVILTYNEALSSTTAAPSHFTIEVDGSAATISGVATSGSTVELTVSSAVKNGQTVTVAYTDPTSGNDNNAIQDSAGNDASSLTSTTVTNHSTVGDHQTTTLVATQDASIKEDSSTNGDWSKNEVYGGSTPVIALVEFDLSSFSKGDSIQSATFRPYVRTLKNNQSSSFSIYSTTAKDWSQSSVKWSMRPPKDQLLDTITITKSGSYVDFEVTNAIQDAIDNGQGKVTLWIEDSEEEYEGFEFDSVNKNASYPNEPELVIVSGAAEPDTTAPTFSSAATSTDGTKVILTYNETLSSTTAATSDFSVKVGGSTATISGVATSGSTVELTLSSAVKNGQTVTVAYTDPTSGNDNNAIQDSAGNDASSLTSTAVTNHSTVGDHQTTTLFASQDASIKENSSTNGDWSKNEVYGGSTPVIALVEFDLSSFSKGDSIQSATFRPYVRTLKNNQSSSFSIYTTTAKDWSQSSVKWSTRPPKDQLLDTITITNSGSYVNFVVTSAIQDAINNGQSKVTLWIEDSEEEYEGFEFDSVNKNASYPNEPELVIVSGAAEPDTTAPTFYSAATSTDGTKVILTYNEALSATTAAPSDFSVKVDGSAAIISSVATASSNVELTLSSAVKNGQTVTVAYTDPTSENDSNATQDSAGNDASSLTSTAVSNTVSPPDTTAPTFSSAATSTDGTKVFLTYNESLSATTAEPSDFSVKVDGSAATISSVATSGSNVELTLSSAVAYGQTITVAYTDPTSSNDSNAIQDAAGNDADNLSTSTVTNNVPQASTNNFVQLLGSNNQSTNNDQFDGCLYAEIGNIKDLDTSKAVEYQWYADGVLMPGYTDVAIRGLRWSDAYKNKSFHVDVTYTPIGSSETKTLSSDSMAWGNFYFNYGGEPGNGYQGTSNTDGIRDIIVMPDFQGNNPKALGSYLQYDNGISEPGNEADRHSIKTVHQDAVGVAAREGEHLIEFSAKEISNRTELGTGDTHHWFYEGEDVYFSYSLYLPKEEWDPVTKYSTIITQLRQFGMHDGPNFGLRLNNKGDYKLIVESMLFDDYPYVATLKPDQWHDIKIHSKQSKGNDGEVNIWINNQLAWEYDGPTMYYSDDAGYISFGMYTEIRDDRKFYVDAIEQTDHLYRVNSLEEWSQLSPGGNPAAPDTTAPTFSSAATSTDGTKVILTYNETLSSTTAAASDFTIEVDGSAATISSVATSGSTVELTLNSAVAYGQTVTVAYTDPSSGNDSNAIQDAAGNDASNLNTTTVTNQVRDTSRTNTGPRILGTAEDYSGVRGVLLADIYGVADLDQTKTTSYQWLANGNAIAGATNQTLDVGDFKSSIENKEISVQLTYTNTSDQETTVTSAVMPYEGFRIVANAEDGRNEWSGTTASEEVTGSVNPYPFVESYSNNGTSSTDGTSAGSAHNITAVKASDVGITAREGDNVIRIYADGSKSNRSELAHLNNETTFKAGEEYYFSGSFFAPKSEWDPVTEGGSTVITQLKQYGGGDPNFELRLSNNGDYKMFWRAVPHSLDDYQDMGSAIPDAWNDLKIYTKHSQGSDGVFRVWLNNEKVIDYSGATMHRSDDGYLKFGMYTEIHDERIIYWDAIDIADHLENDFDTWLSSGDNLPSLTVSGISDNQQFTSSNELTISGSAIDPAGNQLGSSGGIQSVDLFLGDTKIQSTTDSNFSFSNLNLSNGEHNLRLIATDTDGNTAEKSYTIWIGNKPAEVSIEASDFFLGSFSTDADVALTTTAADPDGSIITVEFLANGQLIGTASEGNGNQYSLNWRPSQAGAYSIQVRATDNQGAVTLSDSKAALVGTTITDSKLTATQDVTITQNSSKTGNYSNTEIYGSTSAPKIALVEFDLNNISPAKYIQSAAFNPYVTKLQNAPGTFSIYAAGTENWNQTSANWTDKPSKGKLLDTITISSRNQYVSFNATEALQDAVNKGHKKITLWIEDSEQEQQRFDFASENNTSKNKPAQLVISSAPEALPAPVKGIYELSASPALNPEPGDSNLSGNLADVDADAIAALPLATVADITARQIDQLAPESFQGLEPEQLAELNNKALRSLDAEQVEHLAPDAITGLGADQIQSLKPKVFQALSAEQISRVSGDTIGSIKKTQIRQLKPATIAGLDATHIEALKPTTLQILTTQQLNKLDPDAISGLSAQHIDRLKSTKFKAFTSEQIAELSDAAVGSINRNQIKKLKPDAIAGLEAQHIDALESGLFQAFSIQQIKRLKPTAIASLDIQQAAQIKPNIFKGLSAKQLAAFSTDVIDNLTAGQIQKIPSKAVKGFSEDQLQVLDATQVAALPKRLIKALEPEQLVALNNDAITGLSRTQLQHLPSDGLTGFQRRQIKALSTTAIPGLKPQVLNNLNQRQAKAFTSDQVLALSKRQRKQATAFLDQLTGDQRTLLGLPDDNRSNRWIEPGTGHPLVADLSNISSLL